MSVFAILMAILVGCSSEKEEQAQFDAKDLVGFWTYYSDEGTSDEALHEFGFFADGTCNYTYSYESEDSYEYDFGKGVYSVLGNTLTTRMTFGDETEIWTYTIKSLKKKNKLVLIGEDGETEIYEYNH